MRTQFTLTELQNGILSCSRRHLAKAISLVESTLPADQDLAQELLDNLIAHTGKSHRIGITGVPGVGKSTFIETFGIMAVERGYKPAILAVDPSSSRTGGSILGDKTRMIKLSRMPEVFIRPTPTGLALGGVARRTREAMLLCEAAGFTQIIVETVGVGQSEITVAGMVDFFLMLVLPNAGDELQGIKRGIMEMMDMCIVHKSDTNPQAAHRAAQQISSALHLAQPKFPDWIVPVLLASSTEQTGYEELWTEYQRFFGDELPTNKRIQQLRRHQAVQWMEDHFRALLYDSFYRYHDVQERRAMLEQRVLQQNTSPVRAARELLEYCLQCQNNRL